METNINNGQTRVSRAVHHAAFFCGYSLLIMVLITMETVQTFNELSLTASTMDSTTKIRSAVEVRLQKRLAEKKIKGIHRKKAKKVIAIKKAPVIVAETVPNRYHGAAQEESSSSSQASSSSSSSPAPVTEPVVQPSNGTFPAFEHAQFPISMAVRWGNMTSKAEWGRTYSEMTDEDFIPVPTYNISQLQSPLAELMKARSKNTDLITAKLFYSTRYFGAYDLDSGEYVSRHAGIDIKVPLDTPVYAAGGGKVHLVLEKGDLGLHVIIEHRINGEQFYSIYGHLGTTSVREGQAVAPGTKIGTIGMTGSTSGAHLHFQIDKGQGTPVHTPYVPVTVPTASEASKYTVHPMSFIQEYAGARLTAR